MENEISKDEAIEIVTAKSENYSSDMATEYQYVPYSNENGNFVAITFYKSDAEADLRTTEAKIITARKAICTITLELDFAKQLANHINSIEQ